MSGRPLKNNKYKHLKFTAKQISEILDGEVEGNLNEEVFKLSKIEDGEKGSLTFLSNPKYTPFLYSTNASVVIVKKRGTYDAPLKKLVDDIDSMFDE